MHRPSRRGQLLDRVTASTTRTCVEWERSRVPLQLTLRLNRQSRWDYACRRGRAAAYSIVTVPIDIMLNAAQSGGSNTALLSGV